MWVAICGRKTTPIAKAEGNKHGREEVPLVATATVNDSRHALRSVAPTGRSHWAAGTRVLWLAGHS